MKPVDLVCGCVTSLTHGPLTHGQVRCYLQEDEMSHCEDMPL